MDWSRVDAAMTRAHFRSFSEPVRLEPDIEIRAIATLQPTGGWGYGLDIGGLNAQEPQPYIDIDRATYDTTPGLVPGFVIEVRQRNYRIGAEPQKLPDGLVRIPLVEAEEAEQWRR